MYPFTFKKKCLSLWNSKFITFRSQESKQTKNRDSEDLNSAINTFAVRINKFDLFEHRSSL